MKNNNGHDLGIVLLSLMIADNGNAVVRMNSLVLGAIVGKVSPLPTKELVVALYMSDSGTAHIPEGELEKYYEEANRTCISVIQDFKSAPENWLLVEQLVKSDSFMPKVYFDTKEVESKIKLKSRFPLFGIQS